MPCVAPTSGFDRAKCVYGRSCWVKERCALGVGIGAPGTFGSRDLFCLKLARFGTRKYNLDELFRFLSSNKAKLCLFSRIQS